jgi:hypothetical protein
MNDSTPPVPLAYHRDLAKHFRDAEPGLWAWFASSRQRSEEAEALRLDLLKSTYRLDSLAHPTLFALVDELRESMGVVGTVSIYQAHSGEGINASLAYLPNEAHIVFAGPVLTVLSAEELKALLAHELAHFLLFEGWEGAYLTTADLIRGLAGDASAGREFVETVRLWSLYTELFADRWALRATGDLGVAVRTLVKAQTGLADVNADSYLRQAADIFRAGPVKANQLTHPELYIRARALELWASQGGAAEAEIERLIQGQLSVERLDVLAQRRAADLTRSIIAAILAPAWLRTEANLAHARQFFPDFEADAKRTGDIAAALQDGDDSLRDYGCFLLLDFATADRELGDTALAVSILAARDWGIDTRFVELAQKELGLTKKAWARLEKDATDLVKQAISAADSEASA